MKRVALEAGGKKLLERDLRRRRPSGRRRELAFGAFYNQGQVCSANSRILIERAAHDEFVALLAAAARDYEPSDPLAGDPGNGSLISRSHADAVGRAIGRAATDGTLVSGGDRVTITGSDAYLRPAIVTGLGADHELHRVEVFGPLVVVLPFETEDEAIAFARTPPTSGSRHPSGRTICRAPTACRSGSWPGPSRSTRSMRSG